MTVSPRLSLPVAVVLARRNVRRAGWTVASWRAVGVLMGERLACGAEQGVQVRTDAEEEHFLWAGLSLDLYRDATESYRTNLTGERPALYVLCHDLPQGGIRPVAVTADPHEAAAVVEGDSRVLDAPIPPEILHHVEAFVVEHHRPDSPGKGKRKRANWLEQSQ
jgi:Protein of unknown function (DUF3305)